MTDYDREREAQALQEYVDDSLTPTDEARTAIILALARAEAHGRQQAGKQEWTIDNIYTIARRESRRAELRPEMWAHVLRLCEAVGAKSRTVGVMRAGESDDPSTD